MSARAAPETRLLAAVNDDETDELLVRLIAAPTENPPGNESAAVDAVLPSLLAAGIPWQFDEVAPGRPNLEVRYGPARGPVLLINVHTDTMPAGAGWTHPPHQAVIRDGNVYGRGACDVKGGLAATLEALLAVQRAGLALRGRILLDLVVDEEGGGSGTRRAVERGRRADWAIMIEPTDLVVLHVGNGQVNFEVVFEGEAAHGSMPEAGRNAIYDAALFATFIEAENRRLAQDPHPVIGPASYNVGTIEGGVQTSIVPARCRVTVDRRILPGQMPADATADLDELLERLRAARPGLRAQRSVLIAVPPIETAADLPLCRTLRDAVTDVLGEERGLGGLRATSDAAQLTAVGIPVVVFGPGSTLRSAHRADEFVPLAELHAATRALALTIARLLA